MVAMWLQISVVAVLALVPSARSSEKPNDFGILEWVHNSEGGFYNPKQDFRREDPNDPTSPIGIFAKERIEDNETLIVVPWDIIIKPDVPVEPEQLTCRTVFAVAREMSRVENGKGSPFAPYIRYLNAQADNQLPSTWSEEGKILIQALLGGTINDPLIPPDGATSWMTEFHDQCMQGRSSTPLTDKAAMLVIQRADDELMVPGYDFYNHRNGRWFNTETLVTRGEHHVTTATRTIEKGEQIYLSYNDCNICEGREFDYGTAEIFRDYGFVERFPQRWYFKRSFEVQFDLEKLDDGELKVIWKDGARLDEPEDIKNCIVWLRKQVRRLLKIKNLKYPNDSAAAYNIPQHEWDMIWEFRDAYMAAMRAAIHQLQEDSGEDKDRVCTMDDYSNGGTCFSVEDLGNHYDALDREFDHLPYRDDTCDMEKIFEWEGYTNIHSTMTRYQRIQFDQNLETKDICMDLDSIVQICSCYRPHYHEFVVHSAARFVDSIKRVIFIGGGDAMLLHEILKYPDLELVVGLELDQMVTRKAFQYFWTQPHFDDERVEWWYGDATKSLLLLPKDYWQSFDLVLVDLSETVMSLTVTKELDVFSALALLLKPEGVMVKNELYMEKFSEVFDNSMQVYFPSPIICDQVLAMGSHNVDFLHAPLKDHGVETLLYEPLVTNENKYDILHDYRKNDALAEGKCGGLGIPEEPTEQVRSAGVTEIVEAEGTSIPLVNTASLKESLLAAIKQEGFELVASPETDNNLVFIVMKEGYVVARLWPEHQYCGFDISLWGSFHKMKSLQTALTTVVGSTSVSSYRVVVGGMYGSSTWREDEKLIGPKRVQTRNCERKEKGSSSPVPVKQIVTIALNETIDLVGHTDIVVAVLCGKEKSEVCTSADFLKSHASVGQMHTFWTCPGLDHETFATNKEKMLECEKSFNAQLDNAFEQSYQKTSLFVIDSAVSYPMLQILNSVLDEDVNRKSWIEDRNVFATISLNPSAEPWRSNFLDRYRKQYLHDPVARGEFLIEAGETSIQLGVVTCDDVNLAYHLETGERNLRHRFTEEGLDDISVELRTIHGGLFPYIDDYDSLKTFSQFDYDSSPGLKQYNQQEPLGSQHIFQITQTIGQREAITAESLDHALYASFRNIVDCEVSRPYLTNDVGDGTFISYACDRGNAILVWDGREHIDVNFFIFEEEDLLPDRFVQSILLHLSEQKLEVGLRDDMPRGFGRVVNFRTDMA